MTMYTSRSCHTASLPRTVCGRTALWILQSKFRENDGKTRKAQAGTKPMKLTNTPRNVFNVISNPVFFPPQDHLFQGRNLSPITVFERCWGSQLQIWSSSGPEAPQELTWGIYLAAKTKSTLHPRFWMIGISHKLKEEGFLCDLQLSPCPAWKPGHFSTLHGWEEFFFFLATLHGFWDVSSPTKHWTQALGSESAQSQHEQYEKAKW